MSLQKVHTSTKIGGFFMFILFGWGKQTIKKHGPVFKSCCERCKNEEVWQLYTRRTWITLFFIPVIPYCTERLVVCPVCSHGIVINNEKFQELKVVADCNTEELNRYGMGDFSAEKNDFSGKTETQINYLKQMEELRKAKEAQSNNSEE